MTAIQWVTAIYNFVHLLNVPFVPDPFVKVYLLVNGKRVKKKKTATKKSSCNPVWNEALTFSLSPSNLPNASVEVRIGF